MTHVSRGDVPRSNEWIRGPPSARVPVSHRASTEARRKPSSCLCLARLPRDTARGRLACRCRLSRPANRAVGWSVVRSPSVALEPWGRASLVNLLGVLVRTSTSGERWLRSSSGRRSSRCHVFVATATQRRHVGSQERFLFPRIGAKTQHNGR